MPSGLSSMTSRTVHLAGDASNARPLGPEAKGAAGVFSISLHDGPAAIATEWRALETEAVTPLFQSLGWIEAWCRTAASPAGETPLIVAGRDEAGRLAFVWPLAVTRRLGVPTLTWLGQSFGGYFLGVYRRDAVPLLTQPVLQELFGRIADERPELAASYLTGMPLHWQGIENPLLQLGRDPFAVPAYEVALPAEFTTLYDACFGKKTQSGLRRKEKQLAALGEVLIGVAEAGDERLALYETFKVQKARQLAADGKANVFADPAIDAFFADLASQPASASALELSSLDVGDDHAATFMGARFKDRYYFLQTSLGEGEPQRSSPGLILMRETIARQCREGVSVFDMGPGFGPHKATWKPQSFDRFALSRALSPRGIVPALLARAALHLREVMRNSKRVDGLVRRLRALVAGRTA